MKYDIKKKISAFIAIILSVAILFSCICVKAADLPNSGVVPYNSDTAVPYQFVLDNTASGYTVPEVTMEIFIGEPPEPEYDLSLDWGAMKLTYIFETDGTNADKTPKLSGGSWGTSFNRTNNKIKITNNSTTKDIEGKMTYTNTSSVDSSNLSVYSGGVTLASYDSVENIYTDITYEQEYTLGTSGNSTETANYAEYYIYTPDDLYAKVRAGEMTAPTTNIVEGKVGIITIKANYVK